VVVEVVGMRNEDRGSYSAYANAAVGATRSGKCPKPPQGVNHCRHGEEFASLIRQRVFNAHPQVPGVARKITRSTVHVWHLFAHFLPEGQQAIDRAGGLQLAPDDLSDRSATLHQLHQHRWHGHNQLQLRRASKDSKTRLNARPAPCCSKSFHFKAPPF
jgi:hypothetical protein